MRISSKNTTRCLQ